MSELEPAAVASLDRTRSAVLNVLVVVGLGIAASGLILGRRDEGALHWPIERETAFRRGVHALLLVLIVASFVVRRTRGGRAELRDPGRRASRFYWSHVVAAIVGGAAIGPGFAYGWAIRPDIRAVAPFWVAALALGFLALPREIELEGFDEPMPERSESRP